MNWISLYIGVGILFIVLPLSLNVAGAILNVSKCKAPENGDYLSSCLSHDITVIIFYFIAVFILYAILPILGVFFIINTIEDKVIKSIICFGVAVSIMILNNVYCDTWEKGIKNQEFCNTIGKYQFLGVIPLILLGAYSLFYKAPMGSTTTLNSVATNILQRLRF